MSALRGQASQTPRGSKCFVSTDPNISTNCKTISNTYVLAHPNYTTISAGAIGAGSVTASTIGIVFYDLGETLTTADNPSVPTGAALHKVLPIGPAFQPLWSTTADLYLQSSNYDGRGAAANYNTYFARLG